MAPIPFRTIAGLSRAFAAALVTVLTLVPLCRASDLLFIRSAAGSPVEQEQMETAAKFYGLNLRVIAADDNAALKSNIEPTDIVGVVIAANALTADNARQLPRALNANRKVSIPILILGVTDKVDPAALKAWSGGTVSGCTPSESTAHPQYAFGRVDGLTGPLSDVELWGASGDALRLVVEDSSTVEQILGLRDNDRTLPVFVKTQGQPAAFVACSVRPDDSSPYAEGIVNAFLRLAPAIMFAKYSAGAHGWHAPAHYANLTIDDPWLRQPYGYVDYKGLLEEMKKHNFHTTIAFIPWNYQRSQPEVVSLFKSHPERFSIAIHGDNHDHKEFTDYRTKPLALQIDAMKQSLARMEQFKALTGIPYDRVMVFPHSIAPLGTLEVLKLANYWGTVNGSNIPQGEISPSPLAFVLRPSTFSFAGFPSVNRHSIAAPVPGAFMAVNAYLDNPMFFYGHTEDFENGPASFNAIADDVNRFQPDTHWAGLGEISTHMYLTRVREDADYDVRALSNHFCVANSTPSDATFHVQKEEIGAKPIDSLLVDGRPQPYELKDGQLLLNIKIAKGATKCIAVQYGKDLDLSSVVTGHDSSEAYLLRMASDFRDIYLSKIPGGVAFIRFYNAHEIKPASLLGFGFALLALCIYGAYRLRILVRTERHS